MGCPDLYQDDCLPKRSVVRSPDSIVCLSRTWRSVPIGSRRCGASHRTESGAASGRCRLRWRIVAHVRAAFQSMRESG